MEGARFGRTRFQKLGDKVREGGVRAWIHGSEHKT